MQNLTIDTGVQAFTINGRGPLRFNPGDPNLYHRFFAMQDKLPPLDAEITAKFQALQQDAALTEEQRAAAALQALADYDAQIKTLLGEIFGPENDFNTMLDGVNLAAVAANGQRVVQNLLETLAPILEQGAQRTVQAQADAAVQQADAARAARKKAV